MHLNAEHFLNRRTFLGSALVAASGAFPQETGALGPGDCGCMGEQPLCHIIREKLPTLIALAEVQLAHVWQGCPAECAESVALDVVKYVEHITFAGQQAVCLGLTSLDFYSLFHAGRRFSRLPLDQRALLLNQGEHPQRDTRFPLISWDCDYALHTGLNSLIKLVKLVIYSRPPARALIGFTWARQCMDVKNLVHIPAPPYPDLRTVYDICIVGSGAGGSVVAARAAEAGKRVLIVEEGKWISPDGLVQRCRDEAGREWVEPARDDHSLIHLYQGAGINLAGRAGDPETDRQNFDYHMIEAGRRGLTMLGRLRNSTPEQLINVLEARVVGGGPYINNAIHIELEPEVWHGWGSCKPSWVSFEQMHQRMRQVCSDLGVNTEVSRQRGGLRAEIFVRGCQETQQVVEPLPLAIDNSLGADSSSCAGCGSDNLIDPFGNHIGGLHRIRDGGPRGYLMRALLAGAEVAYETRALAFSVHRSAEGGNRVTCLLAEERRGLSTQERGSAVTICARQFVLAAGPAASTIILQHTACRNRIHFRGLGQNYTGNVVSPMYAVFDQPFGPADDGQARPGLAQCFFIRPQPQGAAGAPAEPGLQNWFHFPGTLCMALAGWFEEYVAVMHRYNHLAVCGMVVPTSVRRQNHVDCEGRVHLKLSTQEFELLLAGLRKIGRIYLAVATADNGVTLFLPTKGVLLDSCQRPVRIRDLATLDWSLNEVRRRGPAFLNMATVHPQGGTPLGQVVDPESFRVQDCRQRPIENLYAVGASILPTGCGVNPQLTIKALASFAAEVLLRDAEVQNHAANPLRQVR
jgi:choline dehydrogenase-like flavoprotein